MTLPSPGAPEVDPAVTLDPRMGVVFAPEDYAGFFRRLLIIAIDFTVLALHGLGLASLSYALGVTEDLVFSEEVFLVWLVLAFGYLVFLEASPWGTLGFLATGVRIIDLKGNRPSYWRMTFRLLLWVFGPISPLVDFYWLSGDPYGQTLRDKFAGTLVIRRKAVPRGVAPIRLNRYQFWEYSFVFYEVDEPQAPSKASSTPAAP